MCTPVQKTSSISKWVVPLIVGGFHSAALMVAGDLTAQTFIENREVDLDEIDFRRTAKFGAIGFIYVGPIISFWNGVMNRFIVRRTRPIQKAFNRTVCTQIYMAPTLTLGAIGLSSLAKEEKMERKIVEDSLQRDFINIMEKNYIVWPITQFLCTSLRPSIKFVLLSTATILWSAYLSTVLMGGNSSKYPVVKKPEVKDPEATSPNGETPETKAPAE